MDFLIADTVTDSLARLTGDEQKAVKTTLSSGTSRASKKTEAGTHRGEGDQSPGG